MACNAPWIPTITFQMVPPLKFSGDWVIIVQISASFSFQVFRAFSKFCTTQLSLKIASSFQQSTAKPKPHRVLRISVFMCFSLKISR